MLDDDEGRQYGYENPGFYADSALGDKISSTDEVHGDNVHEKVGVSPGDVLFIEDDQGVVFEIAVQEKPSTHRILLDVTRR